MIARLGGLVMGESVGTCIEDEGLISRVEFCGLRMASTRVLLKGTSCVFVCFVCARQCSFLCVNEAV